MKNLLLSFSFFFISFLSFTQCPTSTITLSSQEEVNSFQATYPNCTQLQSRLNISGDDIVSLLPLSILENFHGILDISDNPLLEELTGLENLEVTGSSPFLFIQNNASLISTQGLEGLFRDEQEGENDLLIDIRDNNDLENISGFEQITRLENLSINNNESLLNLSGLINVSEIDQGSGIYITNNNSLTSLVGLDNIASIITYLNIISNDSLLDISSLSQATFEYEIQIKNNSLLSVCGYSPICNLINENTNSISIENNAFGCNSEAEVLASCSNTCPEFAITLSSQAEVDAFAINYPNCTNLVNDLTISGDDISDLTGLEMLSSTNSRLTISDNPLLENANQLNLFYMQGGISMVRIMNNPLLLSLPNLTHDDNGVNSLFLENNPLLENLNGFIGVTRNDFFSIINCSSLTSLSGLSNLNYMRGVELINNVALVSISELGSYSGDIDYLLIKDNPNLQNLVGLEGIMYTGIITFSIENNDSLINLEGLTNASGGIALGISDNDALQSFDGLNNAMNFELIYILNNPNLTDISNLENNGDIFELQITGNTNLSECSMINICNFVSGSDEFVIENNASGCNSQQEILDNCQEQFFALSGNVRFDLEMNGCDTNDVPSNNLLISAESDTNQYATITNDQGDYFMFLVEEGDYEITIQSPLPTYFDADPVSQSITYDATTTSEIVDICITATQIVDDLKVVIVPITDARPGFESEYLVAYENTGSTIQSGEIVFTYQNERQEFVEVTQTPTQIEDGELTFEFSDLYPFQLESFVVTLLNFEPPINESGDELNPEVQMFPIDNDLNPADNYDALKQIIVNSFDPNDKQVTQGPEIFEEEVGDYLNYLVRFQNLGTASAINVRVEDILSDNLDWTSFRVLASSHEYRLEIINGNEVTFFFDDIDLPAEQDDEEGSNGYVAFQIKTNEDLQIGDTIENTADIYFDFNPAIVTNTVITTVVEPLNVNEFDLDGNIAAFPNPVEDVLQINVSNGIAYKNAVLFNLLGEELIFTQKATLSLNTISSGVYFLSIHTDSGTLVKKILKK